MVNENGIYYEWLVGDIFFIRFIYDESLEATAIIYNPTFKEALADILILNS